MLSCSSKHRYIYILNDMSVHTVSKWRLDMRWYPVLLISQKSRFSRSIRQRQTRREVGVLINICLNLSTADGSWVGLQDIHLNPAFKGLFQVSFRLRFNWNRLVKFRHFAHKEVLKNKQRRSYTEILHYYKRVATINRHAKRHIEHINNYFSYAKALLKVRKVE